MDRIHNLVEPQLGAAHAGKLTPAQFRKLATQVKAEVGGIVTNCKLEPEADAMLHLVIADLGAGTDAMACKVAKTRPVLGLVKVAQAVKQYGSHFDHPSFKPIRNVNRLRKISIMKFTIPQPLQHEHEALHARLRHATQAGGEAAIKLAHLMHPHFIKEDQIALPPLGLLAALARGEWNAEMAEGLVEHARTEVEVMYPASVLVGQLVWQRLGQHAPVAACQWRRCRQGHRPLCPTVAGAWLMTRTALAQLYPGETARRGEIRVELRQTNDEGVAGVIASVAGLVTGAANEGGFKGLAGRFARNGLLRFGMPMRGEMRFTRLDNGRSVELSHRPQVVPPPAGISELLRDALAPQASTAAWSTFADAWQGWVQAILTEHAEDPALIEIAA